MTDYTIGLLHTGYPERFGPLVDKMLVAARTRLGAGHTINILDGGRYAYGNMEDLDDFAEELVNNTTVPVIVAAGGPQSAVAVMEAAVDAPPGSGRRRVNIVFTTVTDPDSLGLDPHHNKPGKNLTGTSGQTSELDASRLALLYSYVSMTRPGRTRVGILTNPVRPANRQQNRDVREKAQELGLNLEPERVNNLRGIRQAFRNFRDATSVGVVVMADSYFNNLRMEVTKAARGNNPPGSSVPAIYQWKEFVQEGGLMSYGPKIDTAYETAGVAAARCCLGEAAHSIPIAAAGNFELWINTQTAGSLTFPVPNSLPNPAGGPPIPVMSFP